jgi:hypothetical protein
LGSLIEAIQQTRSREENPRPAFTSASCAVHCAAPSEKLTFRGATLTTEPNQIHGRPFPEGKPEEILPEKRSGIIRRPKEEPSRRRQEGGARQEEVAGCRRRRTRNRAGAPAFPPSTEDGGAGYVRPDQPGSPQVLREPPGWRERSVPPPAWRGAFLLSSLSCPFPGAAFRTDS